MNQERTILTGVLQDDFQKLEAMFERTFDFTYRNFEINFSYDAVIVFLDGLVNMDRLDSNIISPLLQFKGTLCLEAAFPQELENAIFSAALNKCVTLQEVASGILDGNTVLLIDGFKQALIISEKTWEQRSVEEPATEAVVYGPREGFIENLHMNTSLIRRRLRTTQLKMESMTIGALSKTEIVITYLDGIADPGVVEEVRTRLNRIQIDAIEESSYIQEFIEDNPYSVFPQVLQTERPDRVVGNLLEGRIGIFCDNTPFVLIVPITFYQLMNATEDYYERFLLASAIRCLRYLFLGIALLFPSIYIAVTTYHQELLPTNLLFSVAAARESVPFPVFVAALLMEISFEALREAGIRLPRPVGGAVSIVGALVIGQAAVQAGIVGAPLVIVVSITGIASFMFPSYSLTGAIRLLRFPMMFLAAVLGLYGILLGIFFIVIHLTRLRSFGVPYLSPIAPFTLTELKDVMVRAPWWAMSERPHDTAKKNTSRFKKWLRPQSPNRKN
ncbi:spore germination protein [Paenibacillus aceris]|uniref:Spore germination protein KA n=1 Tax=Paenibacillus aceris TaxID=869555 RepID=A0ABS4I0T6_9BACL|nr:spore germination protein [Paenibacillus aceris]MBP1964425.1 spore germination protein KA [Paenibacillus aceris]NHW35861.1 spore germination protein [Paenibacillus aceris]